ncbi:MAG TPA: hypothetical protein VFB52_04770 [Solirubrobacterales bacterium]|nr:hypothetical protein [Solirubrobacterales bacterium]
MPRSLAKTPTRKVRAALIAAALACVLLLLLVPPAGADAAGVAARKGSKAKASADHFRFFSPASFWNAPVPAAAKLDQRSAKLVRALSTEVEAELADASGPWIGTSRYSVPIYTVPASQPAVRVKLTSPIFSPPLQAAFDRVPLPPEATPSGGTDGHLVVWQPSTDRMWEFWRLVPGAEPSASWGGAMENVSANRGVYDTDAWPDAEPWWGASASSLPVAGGLITLEDLREGEIDHALAIALPEIRAGVYAAPAQRTDGKSASPLALPEGARLRLDPKLDLAKLQMPRVTRLIAEAAQRYGIFVRDGAGGVQLFAQDPVTAAKNPYTGPNGYFEGRYPHQLLASFPWERLQVLKLDLHPDG